MGTVRESFLAEDSLSIPSSVSLRIQSKQDDNGYQGSRPEFLFCAGVCLESAGNWQRPSGKKKTIRASLFTLPSWRLQVARSMLSIYNSLSIEEKRRTFLRPGFACWHAKTRRRFLGSLFPTQPTHFRGSRCSTLSLPLNYLGHMQIVLDL